MSALGSVGAGCGRGAGGVIAAACADALAMVVFVMLARTHIRNESKVFKVGAIYALNPVNALAVGAASSFGLTRACVYGCFLASMSGRALVSGNVLSLAVQLNPSLVSLAPSLIVMCAGSTLKRKRVVGAQLAIGFLIASVASFMLMGDDFPKWLRAAVKFTIMSEDQTPNLGLHWYLFTTMFAQFRLFYTVALNAFPLAMSVPLSIRFAKRPLVAATLTLVLTTIYAPYPTVSDAVTYISLLSIIAADDDGNPLVYMKYGVLIAGGFLYVALLSPLTWYMWIHTRVANANFYYAVTLVYAFTQMLLLNEVAKSVMLFDRHRKNKRNQ
jgi:phosphatidylinositol glycan class U